MTTPAHESLVQALRDARRAIDTLRSELHAQDLAAMAALHEREAIRSRLVALEKAVGDPESLRTVATRNWNTIIGWGTAGAAIVALILLVFSAARSGLFGAADDVADTDSDSAYAGDDLGMAGEEWDGTWD